MDLELLVRFVVLIGLLSKGFGQDVDNMYRCPDHLSRTIYLKAFKDKCYRFEKSEMYWTSARDRCSGEQGTLIQIRNQETQNWVVNTLNALHWSTDGVWIGAHDRDKEMDWRWVTGERITWSYWASGQPSCGWFCVEDCGSLRRDDGGRWHDKQCSSWLFTYSFICQFDMKPATTTTITTTTPTTTTPTTTTPTTTTPTTTTPTTTTPTTTTPTTTTPTTTTPTTTTPTTTTPTTTTPTTTTPTTTIPTTTTTKPTTQNAPTTTTMELVTYNISVVDAFISKDKLSQGALAGLVVACVLGAVVLLMLISVCFYKSRKKEDKENNAMFFDNITYTVRSVLPSSTRISRHEQNLNNQVPTGSPNDYTDVNECATACKPIDSNDCTKIKEQSHYSEITDQMAADKLNVYLPKYDNAEYEKCNIAKSKLGPVDTAQYLDVCENSKGVYDSVSGDEMACNAMNEQLESNKNAYDECGNVERGDNPPNHYMDMDNGDAGDTTDRATCDGETTDGGSLQLEIEPGIYEELNNKDEQPSSINDIFVNFEGNLDLAKGPSGYSNNIYNSDA